MQKCRGGSSTGAGLRPFPSHSMRSMSLPALPLGGRNSLDRCALNPVARGQPRPVRGRRAQPAAAPWPPTAWAGLPTVALQRGARPRTPRRAYARPTFEKLNQGRGGGARRRAWTSLRLAHPRHRRTRARNPSGWVTKAAGARCAKARQGAQPWGSGGASPLPGSALGAAGTAQAKRAGGPWTPPSGGLFTPKGRTTLL